MSQVWSPVFYVAEPPAQHLARPPVVVDCSALASLLFHDEGAALLAGKIHRRTLHAPFLLQIEIASVALKKHRKGFQGTVTDALAHCCERDINLHRVEPQDASALAQHDPLSASDAAPCGWRPNSKPHRRHSMKSWAGRRMSLWPARDQSGLLP